MKIESFSQGKIKNKNEDFFGYNDNTFVITDGDTDKSGKKYKEKTGGELASRIIVKECLNTKLNGVKLVKYLNNKINNLYQKFNVIHDRKNAKNRFTCGFICVRILPKEILITYLGDLGFRINNKKIYQEIQKIDKIHSKIRAKFIRKTGDVEGGRNIILPLILKQFAYQNNSRHKLGYGVIDGTKTPKKFIKIFKYPKKNIKTLELFTDGYFSTPKGKTIKDWEKMYKQIEKEDPFKCKKYLSTKSTDDRTILIINF